MIIRLMVLILLQGFDANQKDYQICVRKLVQFFFKVLVVALLATVIFLQLASFLVAVFFLQLAHLASFLVAFFFLLKQIKRHQLR